MPAKILTALLILQATLFYGLSRGEPAVLADFLLTARLPAGAEVLGPVPAGAGPSTPDGGERALIRIERAHGLDLARALHAAQAGRSARKEGGGIRVELDPAEVV